MRVEAGTASLPDLIDAVKVAVEAANHESPPGVRIGEVSVVASMVTESTAGVGFELRIPVVGTKFGGKYGRTGSATRKLEIALVPPAASGTAEPGDAESELLSAIRTVQAAIAAAAAGRRPFLLKSSTVTLDMVVNQNGSVELVGNGSLHGEAAHTVTLTFSPA